MCQQIGLSSHREPVSGWHVDGLVVAIISNVRPSSGANSRRRGHSEFKTAGVDRKGLRILNPNAEESLEAGDEILALGIPGQIDEFKFWICESLEIETSAG